MNAIQWLNAGQSLLIGTVGGEWQIRSSSTDAPITPRNVQVKRQTTYGSAAIAPQRVGNAVLFLQRAGRKIRELTFSFEADGFVVPDLTLLAEHLTGSGITDMTWQQKPHGVLWCVRADSVLLAMTYDRLQDVVAWLADMAERWDCAVVAVRHLNKKSGGKASYRGLGSIDFLAAARSVIMVGTHPFIGAGNRKVLVQIKNNLIERKGLILGYTLEGGSLRWEGVQDVSVEDVLKYDPAERRRETGECVTWLRSALEEGTVENLQEAITAGETRGWDSTVVRTAWKWKS